MRRNRRTMIVSVALIVMSMMIIACENQKVTSRGNRRKIEVVRKKYSSDVIPHKRTLAAGGLQYYWDNQNCVPLRAGERVVRFYAMEENLYLLTNLNNVYTCDSQLGIYRWRADLADRNEYVFAPIHVPDVRLPDEIGNSAEVMSPPMLETFPAVDGVVFFTGNRCRLFNRTTGKLIRHYRFEGYTSPGRSAIGANGATFYSASASRNCHAVNLLCQVKTFALDIEEQVRAPLVTYGGSLYIGTREGHLKCLALGDTLIQKWSLKLGGPIVKEFVINDIGIFVCAEDRHLYGLRSDSGSRLWTSVHMGGHPLAPMQVSSRTAFQLVRENGLVAVDLATGKIRWKKPDALKVIAIGPRTAWLLDKQENLQIIDEITGAIHQSLSLRGFDFYASNTKIPAIFTATTDGNIFCINRKDAGHISLDMLKRITAPKKKVIIPTKKPAPDGAAPAKP